MSALLEIDRVGKRFGGLTALADVSFQVPEGAIVGVMGANGAGKTTLFSLVAGNARPSSGDIRFRGRSIVGLTPDRICRLGVARTFPIVKPFPALTVRENLRTAAMFGHAALRSAAAADQATQPVLEEVGLAAVADQPASTLTLSGQKRLVIEHVMRALMELCERIVVLHHGQLIAEGTPTEIGRDAQVHGVYFGGSP